MIDDFSDLTSEELKVMYENIDDHIEVYRRMGRIAVRENRGDFSVRLWKMRQDRWEEMRDAVVAERRKRWGKERLLNEQN